MMKFKLYRLGLCRSVRSHRRFGSASFRVCFALVLMICGVALAVISAELPPASQAQERTSAPSWTGPLPHAVLPEAREKHAMAYDEARRQIVLFSGLYCDPVCFQREETWTWDGSSWTQQHPVTSPRARQAANMVYDAARQKVVLFGGSSGFDVYGDTWTWDGSNWTEEKPQSSPPRRFFASMAYDAARGETVLFGGENCDGVPNTGVGIGGCRNRLLLGDTWVWNGTNWIQKNPVTSPPAKTGAAMVYDAARTNVVLFGGGLMSNDGVVSNDTWTWDGSNWTPRVVATSPPGRSHATMAYDMARGNAVLFGGGPVTNEILALSDTWVWDGAGWTQKTPATPPPARTYAAMAYDAALSKVILFGGSGQGRLGDAWTWDGTAYAKLPRPWPPGRSTLAMAYDATRGNDVLFVNITSDSVGETFTWDGTIFTQRFPATSPPGRRWDGMAYHSGTRTVVLFGGQRSAAITGQTQGAADTWTWDGLNWTEQHPAISPSGRFGHMMARDVTGKLVLFGGYDGGCLCPVNDTWTWDGAAWTQQQPATSPPARGYAGMAYDPATRQLVLFGGYDRARGITVADTWTWDGSSWTEQHPAAAPSPRMGLSMATDPSTGHAMLFGGALSAEAVNPEMSNEAWLWDGSTWNLQQPAGDGPPAPRWFASLAEHSATGTVVMFGGQIGNPGPHTDETWIWRGVAPVPELTSVASRKAHGSAGPFDINLPLTGSPGVECRRGGANSSHKIIFTFANPVTVNGTPDKARITSGTGTVSNVTVNGAEVTVDLTQVSNAQKITLTLFNVSDGTNTGDVSVPIGVLLGDTSGDGFVNSLDISQTRDQSGRKAKNNPPNFREDLNADGYINSADISIVRTQGGTRLP